jgi:hypothetical protein
MGGESIMMLARRFRLLAVTATAVTFGGVFLSACSHVGVTVGAAVEPAALPIRFAVSFAIQPDGGLEVGGSVGLVTEAGVFSVDASVETKMTPAANETLLIIRHRLRDRLVDSVFKIGTAEAVTVTANGTVKIEISTQKVFINAGAARVSSIMVKNAPITAGTSRTVTVGSDVTWVDTGLTLPRGEAFSVTARGSWTGDGQTYVGPQGSSQAWPDNFLDLADLGACADCAPTHTAHWEALVGYVGNSPPAAGSYTDTAIRPQAERVFLVGANFTGRVNLAGRLWLAFNDDAYSDNTSDNSGQVTATVTLTGP